MEPVILMMSPNQILSNVAEVQLFLDNASHVLSVGMKGRKRREHSGVRGPSVLSHLSVSCTGDA